MSEHMFDTGLDAESDPDAESGSGLRLERDGVDAELAMLTVSEHSRAVDAVRLLRLSDIARLDATRGFERDGFTSVTAFLVARCGMGWGEATREVFLARSIDAMPHAVAAVQVGRLSLSQLTALAHGRASHPDVYAAGEADLVEAVTGLSVADTHRAVAYWSQAHDPAPAIDDVAEMKDRSHLHLSATFEGMGRLDGELDPESLAVVTRALDAQMTAIVSHTPTDRLPTTSQLRAEALTELCRRLLDRGDLPTNHRTRPHLSVLVDYHTLTGDRPGGHSELHTPRGAVVVPPDTIRRLACDADISRIVTGPAGEPLDVGRSRRTVTAAQWKALRIRDRHCRFPGCSRPPDWCDAHHLTPWTDGGPTDLDNLILLCRHHHTLCHEGGHTITTTPHPTLTFHRPDGTAIPNAPP